MSNQTYNEISLKDIFQASQNPNSPIALKCCQYLRSASINKIDHLLRLLFSYTKRDSKDWTPKRLARSLDYIFSHGIKFHLKQNIQLASFKACFRWAVDMFLKTTHDMQGPQQFVQISHQMLYAVKFTCGLMESLHDELPNAHITSSIISDFIRRQGVKGLLFWSQSDYGPIRSYVVRALAAQKHRLAKEIANSGGFITLSKMTIEIPHLLNTLSLQPPVTDAAQQERELKQCVTICHLLDEALKQGNSDLIIAFIDSDVFPQVVSVWYSVCQFHQSVTNGNFRENPDHVTKCQPVLVYSLTSIIQKCTAASNCAANIINESREQWWPLLIFFMRRWIFFNCSQQVEGASKTLEFDNNTLIRLFQILIDIAKVTPMDTDPSDVDSDIPNIEEFNTDKVLLDCTNFLLVYVLQPVSMDTIECIGSNDLMDWSQLLQKDTDGYSFNTEKILRDHSILAPYMEVYVQHFKHASPNSVKRVTMCMANCVKAIAIVLSEQLQTSPLRSRLTSLVMRLIRVPKIIDVFINSSTKISPFLWSPLMDQAKRGLAVAANLSPESELTAEDKIVINRSRNALASLRNIAYRRSGLETLLKCDLLQLIDEAFIPSGEVMQNFTQLLGLYALFCQLISTLCSSALLRRYLGDQSVLPPLIIRLLHEAVILKENRRVLVQKESDENQTKIREDPIFDSCIELISSCLVVVGSFKYVDYAVTMWFAYENKKKWLDKDIVMSEQEPLPTISTDKCDTDDPSNTEKLSILPSLLTILLPWKKKKEDDIHFSDIPYYIDTDLQVMLLASQLLEIYTHMNYVCGRQLMIDSAALSHFGLLLVCLYTARYGWVEKHYYFGPAFPVMTSSNRRTPYEIKRLPGTSDRICGEDDENLAAREEWSELDDNVDDDIPELLKNMPAFHCAEKIKDSVVNILTRDTQFAVMSDAFTSFFKLIMRHFITGTPQDYWRREICSSLYNDGMEYYLELYNFSKNTENAIKLHEMSAVAVGYAAIGAKSGQQWNEVLGLTVLSESMVSIPHVFGTLCQMLVFELEYEDENIMDEPTDKGKYLLKTITPLRRQAAAQAIEALAFSFEKKWRQETLSTIKETKTLPQYIPLANPPEMVSFVTDDVEQNAVITGNRQLLGACSPVFKALLSGDYAESGLTAVQISDVTFHSLELFIRTIHRLNEKAEESKQHVMQNDIPNNLLDWLTSWDDIVDLLQTSDRFASTAVKDFCQYWVLDRVEMIHLIAKDRSVYLNGLLGLYRQCRDPIESDGGITSKTWPFAIVLYEALKTITQYMKETSCTSEFAKMIKDKNMEELDAFCNGIAYFLQRED